VNATSLGPGARGFRLRVCKSEVPFTVARIDAGASAQFVSSCEERIVRREAARMRWRART